ncbi:MAG: NYN domain-containing protein [bacterium]
MKTILIDSNNLLHKVPHLKNLFIKDKEGAQLALIESVKANSNKNEKIIFVFDGFSKIKKTNVIFSNNISADEVMRKQIENFPDYKKLKVVSSDSGITDLARVCGCEVQKSEDYWNELNKNSSLFEGKNVNQNYIYDKPEKPERMNKKEMEEFKKYFA